MGRWHIPVAVAFVSALLRPAAAVAVTNDAKPSAATKASDIMRREAISSEVAAASLQQVRSGGVPGPQGPPGIVFIARVGAPGQPGEPGPIGQQGFMGPPGPDGDSIIGPSGVEGPRGVDGPFGPRGERGEMGPEGPAGPSGDQPVETEKWEKLLSNYDHTLQEMEKYGGMESKEMSTDLGLMYQKIALYHARANMLKNNTQDFEAFIAESDKDLQDSAGKSKELDGALKDLKTQPDDQILKDAEKLKEAINKNAKKSDGSRARQSALVASLLAALAVRP